MNTLAIMGNDARSIFYLLAVISFGVAVVLAYVAHRLALVFVALGLLLAFFVPMYDAFDA